MSDLTDRVMQIFNADGALLSYVATLDDMEIDDILNLRDDKKFSEKWSEFDRLVDVTVLDGKISSVCSLGMESVFKNILNLTLNDDLAAYISDDLELVMKYLISNIENKWGNSFVLIYFKGNIPNGELLDTDYSKIDVINEILN